MRNGEDNTVWAYRYCCIARLGVVGVVYGYSLGASLGVFYCSLYYWKDRF